LDNLTHGITGVGIAYMAQELVNAPQPGLVMTALIASQLPDLDVIIGSRNKTAYLKHHRGSSHSLLLAPVFAFLTALGVKVFTPESNFWLLFLVSFLSLGLHLFFDLLNAYGTKLLWPITNRRYAWDVLMIIDPLIIVLFSIGLIVYIVGNEKGFLFSLYPFLALYILRMVKFRFKAKEYLLKVFRNYKNFSLFPPLWGWRRWNFIVQKGEVFYLGQVDVYSGKVKVKEELCQEEECSLVLATKNNPEVKVFLDFARFPWFSKQQVDEDVIVEWSDLRYRLRERNHFTLLAKPELKAD